MRRVVLLFAAGLLFCAGGAGPVGAEEDPASPARSKVADSPALAQLLPELFPPDSPFCPPPQTGRFPQWAEDLTHVGPWVLKSLGGSPWARSDRRVSEVAFSPDDRLALVGCLAEGQNNSGPGRVILLEVATGREIRVLDGHRGSVRSLAFSPDGRHAFTSSVEKTVRMWNLATGRAIRVFGHPEGVLSVAVTPDGQRLLTGCLDGHLRLLEVETGRTVQAVRVAAGLFDAALLPDGVHALTSGPQATMHLWHVPSGRKIRTLQDPEGRVGKVCVSPDGARALCMGATGTVRIWDLASGRMIRKLLENDAIPTWGVFSPNGRLILAAGRWNEKGARVARLWDVVTGQRVRWFGSHGHDVTVGAFSHGGTLILTGSSKGVRLWETSTGRRIRGKQAGHSDTVHDATFSSDGKLLLSASADYTARVWDTRSGREIRSFEQVRDGPALGFSRDARLVLVKPWPGRPGSLRIVEVRGDRDVRLPDPEAEMTATALSPDGRLVVWGTVRWRGAFGDAPSPLLLWDAATGRKLRVLEGHGASVDSVAFSPDSQRVASSSVDGTARVWDVTTGRTLHVLDGGGGGPGSGVAPVVAFSPDGKLLATASGDKGTKARVWNLATGRQIHEFAHVWRVTFVRFSTDGKVLYTRSKREDLNGWNAWDLGGKQLKSGPRVVAFPQGVAATPLAFHMDARGMPIRLVATTKRNVLLFYERE